MTSREVEDLLAEHGAMIRRELRAEFRREMLELRAEVADLVAEEMYQRVQADKTEADLRFSEDAALQRTMDARTERLV